MKLGSLAIGAAREILEAQGARVEPDLLTKLWSASGANPRSLRLLGSFLARHGDQALQAVLRLNADSEAVDGDVWQRQLMQAYEERLPSPQRTLLQWVCSMPRGAFYRDIAEAMAEGGTEPEAEGIYDALADLCSRGLLEQADGPVALRWKATAIVRRSIEVPPATAIRANLAARAGVDRELRGLPQRPPWPDEALDLLEEAIELQRLAGEHQEAFDTYWFRAGGFRYLGEELGLHHEGLRMLAGFSTDGSPKAAGVFLPATERGPLLNHWGKYARHLGELEAAVHCAERMRELAAPGSAEERVAISELVQARLDRGELALAETHAREALVLAERARDVVHVRWAHALVGRCAHLLGRPDVADDHLDACRIEKQMPPAVGSGNSGRPRSGKSGPSMKGSKDGGIGS